MTETELETNTDYWTKVEKALAEPTTPFELPELVTCQCGAEAPVYLDRWQNWVLLVPHVQPSTKLLCSPYRLQKK